MLDVQPDEFADYFSTETGEDVLIAQVRLLLSYALLSVGRCDYSYGVFDRLSNPFPACLATFIVVKIHIDDDRVNLILVLADCLKQRNGNNAAIENPRIKPLYSVFFLPSPIRCSHRLTRRRPDAQYNKAAWLRQAPFSEKLSRLCHGD